MKKLINLSVLLLVTLSLVLSSCSATKSAAKIAAQYVGEWEYKIEEIPVDLDGTFVITYEEGVFKGMMMTPMGDLEIPDLAIVDGVMKASFEAEGNPGEMEGTFDGNTYKGLFVIQDYEFPMNMEKK